VAVATFDIWMSASWKVCWNHIQNDDYYPTLEDKLTHLFLVPINSIVCRCNKRHSHYLMRSNACYLMGYMFMVEEFLHEMENISYHVAAGSIDKELLHEIITAFLAKENG